MSDAESVNSSVAEEATVNEEVGKVESSQASSPVVQDTESSSTGLESLPEDVRVQLGDINSLEHLAKGYISSQSMIGRSIRIPGEDASQEAKDEFYSKLEQVPGVARVVTDESGKLQPDFFNRYGRPEQPDQYEYKVPDGVELDSEVTGEFSKVAHKIGLTQDQANELLSFEISRLNHHNQSIEKMRNDAEATLKQKWGSDFDARLNGAKTILKHYQNDYPDAIEQIAHSELSNNPALIAMLSDLAGSLQESGTFQGEGGVSYGTTPEEAREMVAEIRSNKSHPFNNPNDPEHAKAKKRMNELYEIMYPGPAN